MDKCDGCKGGGMAALSLINNDSLISDKVMVIENLIKYLDCTTIQADIIFEFTIDNGDCIVLHDDITRVTELMFIFKELGISMKVESTRMLK